MKTENITRHDLEKELAYLGLLDKAREICSEMGDRAVLSFIKSSYKLLSKVYHPDLNPENPHKAAVTQQSLNRLNGIVSSSTDAELLAIIKGEDSFNLQDRTTILIVEDEESIRDAFQSILTLEGYDVKTAKDGISGYSAYRAYSPDLILCDILIPEMNGLDLVARMRKLNPGLKVIYMSGFLEVAALKARLDDDIRRFGYYSLAKPFKPSVLLDVVQEYLERDKKRRKGFSVVV